VWQIPAATFLTGPDVLLPLAPLADLGPGGLAALRGPLGQRLAAITDSGRASQLTACLLNLFGLRYRDMDAQLLIPGMDRIHGFYDNPSVKEYFAALTAEGRAAGQAEGRQELLLALGRKRFGEPPQAVADAVRATTDSARLDALAGQLLDIGGWDELMGHPSLG
jgi:hypothetical protein